jgi:glycerophosphoryl diester phosphodiesterase
MKCKIFAHRGFSSDYNRENSIKALINASDNGFDAVECDIHYLNKEFILSHDAPKGDYKNLDRLDKYLEVFTDQMEYWLDFKNLNDGNVDEAMSNLKNITDKLEMNVQNLYFAPFITEISEAQFIYKTIRKYFGDEAQIVAVKERLLPKDYEKYHALLKENNIYGLSIQFQSIKPEFMKIFADIKIFAWTVNYPRDFARLVKIGVQNIVTDELIPEDD